MTLPSGNSEFGSTAADEPLFGEPTVTPVYDSTDSFSTATTVSTDTYGSSSTDGTDDSADGSAKQKAKDTAADAKDKAADVKDSAVDAGTHVASVAKDQAGTVAAEAGQHAKNLLSQTQNELSSQVSAQQQRVAGGLHSLSQELHSMADGNEQSGVASDLARQAGDRTKAVASWLEGREPGDVLSEVSAFARRRPGMFIALAAGAGVLAGRLARGIKDDSSTDAAPAVTSGTGYTPAHSAVAGSGSTGSFGYDADYAAGTYATSADPITTDGGVIR